MSADRHTPGPWFYRCGDEWSHSVVTHHGELPDGSPNCWTVASINKQREPEHEANARLIALAPELLAAITQLAFMARTSGDPTPELLKACEGAEAVIAKRGVA